MSKKPTDKQMDVAKRHVAKYIHRWKPLVGLAHWEIRHYYYRREKDIPKVHKRAAMWCAVEWEYLTATVHVALCRIAHESAEEIEEMVRHELLHATVNEMRQWRGGPVSHGMGHEERTVSTLTAAFLWTFNAGWNASRDDLRKLQERRAKKKGLILIGGKEYRVIPAVMDKKKAKEA